MKTYIKEILFSFLIAILIVCIVCCIVDLCNPIISKDKAHLISTESYIINKVDGYMFLNLAELTVMEKTRKYTDFLYVKARADGKVPYCVGDNIKIKKYKQRITYTYQIWQKSYKYRYFINIDRGE